jgi:hypothetical protein
MEERSTEILRWESLVGERLRCLDCITTLAGRSE